MKQVSTYELRELISDIETELLRLDQVAISLQQVRISIQQEPKLAGIFYESLALKLHNFYTGCERIFQLITSELNGSPPSGYDWYKRLLERMSKVRENRPAIISLLTAQKLQEYLGFRHIVRNLYGFELDPERIDRLVEKQEVIWQQFAQEIRLFMSWLQQLSNQIEAEE